MTLRVSDWQSESDLDSIRNSCAVCELTTPGTLPPKPLLLRGLCHGFSIDSVFTPANDRWGGKNTKTTFFTHFWGQFLGPMGQFFDSKYQHYSHSSWFLGRSGCRFFWCLNGTDTIVLCKFVVFVKENWTIGILWNNIFYSVVEG